MCTLDLFPVPDSFTLSQVNLTHARKAPPPTSYTHLLESNYISHGRSAWHGSCQAGSSVWQDGISPSQSENAVHPLENSKRTEALAGATFVQAVKLEYEGKKAIIFAFSVNISPLFYLSYFSITRLSDCFLSGFGGEDGRYFHSEI
jgi:hypothetical protein